jgi:hypothetical protein
MPPMTPLLLGFVSHHQQVALILIGVMFASRFTPSAAADQWRSNSDRLARTQQTAMAGSTGRICDAVVGDINMGWLTLDFWTGPSCPHKALNCKISDTHLVTRREAFRSPKPFRSASPLG